MEGEIFVVFGPGKTYGGRRLCSGLSNVAVRDAGNLSFLEEGLLTKLRIPQIYQDYPKGAQQSKTRQITTAHTSSANYKGGVMT